MVRHYCVSVIHSVPATRRALWRIGPFIETRTHTRTYTRTHAHTRAHTHANTQWSVFVLHQVCIPEDVMILIIGMTLTQIWNSCVRQYIIYFNFYLYKVLIHRELFVYTYNLKKYFLVWIAFWDLLLPGQCWS